MCLYTCLCNIHCFQRHSKKYYIVIVISYYFPYYLMLFKRFRIVGFTFSAANIRNIALLSLYVYLTIHASHLVWNVLFVYLNLVLSCVKCFETLI